MRRDRKIGGALALILCCGGIGAVLSQQPVKNKPAPVEYELVVGNTTYDIALDQPFTIKTPAGEEVQAVLHHKKAVRYEGYGIKFDYPSVMKVSVDEDIGFATVTLDTTGSTLAMIQVYTVPIADSELSRAIVQELDAKIKNTGAKLTSPPGQTIKRQIGGVERTGKLLSWKLGGTAFRDELYIFQKGTKKIAMLLQTTSDESKTAGDMFAVITNSFE